MGNCSNVKSRPTNTNRPISKKQNSLLESNSSSKGMKYQQGDYEEAIETFEQVINSFREGLLVLNSEQDEILFINQSAENIFNGGLVFAMQKPKITINHFRTERKFKLVDFEDLKAQP